MPKAPPLVLELLRTRGLRDEQLLDDYLFPSLSKFPQPHTSLLDLDEALKILISARDLKKKLVVFGDYDVDGATSTSLLFDAFEQLGFEVGFFVPHRMKEGYGLSAKACERLLAQQPDARVIVTCDCGVSSFEGVEYLKSKGLQVIITDHHEAPAKRVRADAVLNPKQAKCQYPDKKLAGVGVAFLLILGLRRALNKPEFSVTQFLDLVALGTVCDLAPLEGANRILVKAGLQRLKATSRVGLQALAQVAGLDLDSLRAQDLGFRLGPRLNAVGRVGDPKTGVELLLSRDLQTAMPLAEHLQEMNEKRRSWQKEQTDEALITAKNLFEANPKRSSLCIFNSNFHLGLVGLVASRLNEVYQRPSCVLTDLTDEHALADLDLSLQSEEIIKGSLRAPAGYHLAEILSEIQRQTDIFVSFGGHAQAAGVSMRAKHFELFSEMFEKLCSQRQSLENPYFYDLEVKNWDGVEHLIDWLEPMGQANPAPRFLIRGIQVNEHRVMKEEHIKLFGRHNGKFWSLLQFRSPYVTLLQSLKRGQFSVDIIGELTENCWRGEKKLEFQIKELIELKAGGETYDVRSISTNEVGSTSGARKASSSSNTHSAQSGY